MPSTPPNMAASPHHRTMFEDGDIRALPYLRLPYRATLASNAASHITYMDYFPKTSTPLFTERPRETVWKIVRVAILPLFTKYVEGGVLGSLYPETCIAPVP